MVMFGPPSLVIATAINIANKSPCAKSKRGVVLYTLLTEGRLDIHSKEHNSPPWPFECDATDECKRDCPRVAVHAEQRALISGQHGCRTLDRLTIDDGPEDPEDDSLGVLQLVHVKTVDGALVPSPGPSCDQCSKLIVEAGVHSVWLYERVGWSRYNAATFHQITLRHCGLHCHL